MLHIELHNRVIFLPQLGCANQNLTYNIISPSCNSFKTGLEICFDVLEKKKEIVYCVS